MLVTVEATAHHTIAASPDDVWTAITAEDPGVERIQGPKDGEVGCTYLMRLPATAHDGLPAVYVSTLTQVAPGHMYTCQIVGPLLEQTEVWTLHPTGDRTVIEVRAWVRASSAVYDAAGLQARTQQMLDNAVSALSNRCRPAA